MTNTDFWSDRYKKEGEIWLNDPSLTALFVEQVIGEDKDQSILEVGFGYGRDIAYLASKRFQVSGIEQSEVGYQMAKRQIQELSVQNTSTIDLIQGDFLTTHFNQKYDVIYSHRVAHLFNEGSEVQRFAQKLAALVKPKGRILISARDARGTKPKRKGHQVNFWNEARFETVFGDNFLIEQFVKGEEIESKSNPTPTYFTLMIAERKP
ncbi:MAG: class I SAM-dependent methyltransferase [Bacteroidota bacterium]